MSYATMMGALLVLAGCVDGSTPQAPAPMDGGASAGTSTGGPGGRGARRHDPSSRIFFCGSDRYVHPSSVTSSISSSPT